MITIAYDAETGQYEAHDRETGVSSCGSTVVEAFENVLDGIEVYRATRLLPERGAGVAQWRRASIS